MSGALTQMKLLVVDDNAINLELIEQVLGQAGYTNVLSTRDPDGVARLCEAWCPDLVLLDLHMPLLSGFQVMTSIRKWMQEPDSLPVLVVTADATVEARHRALSMGARDFITKPIDQVELLLRAHNLLHTRQLQRQLAEQNAMLDETVRDRTAELEQARLESLTILAAVGEFHDDATHEHTQRVGRSAARIAQALQLPEPFVATIRYAAPLHDIGKVGISRQILRKPGALSDEERSTMEGHPTIGAKILASAGSPVLALAAEIAQTHHERWDGLGYPTGLAGRAIPIAGRITAVADVFDALTHERPYKPAWEISRAVELIATEAGRQFDAEVVAAFTSLDPKIVSNHAVGVTLVAAS